MDQPKPRIFRANSLLALVVFVAVVAGAVAGTKRYVERTKDLETKAVSYRQLAVQYAVMAEDAERWRKAIPEMAKLWSGPGPSFYRRLEQKYLRAAEEPWKPVPPDPPETPEEPDGPTARPAPVAPPTPREPPRIKPPVVAPVPRWPDSDPV